MELEQVTLGVVTEHLSIPDFTLVWFFLFVCFLFFCLFVFPVESVGISDELKTKLKDVLIQEQQFTLGRMLGKGKNQKLDKDFTLEVCLSYLYC